MKFDSLVWTAALLGLAGPAWAGVPCLSCGSKCVPVPSPSCPDCSCPCDEGHHHCSPKKSERAGHLLEQLAAGDCCARIKAAQKLGCRLHADFCCDPAVLHGLAGALQGDPCWEVRRAAAWSIARQKARVEQGVLSLYVASRLDPHFLVRDKAAEALDILLVCRRDCFKELLAGADELIKTLRGKYKPGSPGSAQLFSQCCAAAGLGSASTGSVAAPLPPGSEVEQVSAENSGSPE